MGEKFLIDTNVLIDLQNNTIQETGLKYITEIIDDSFIISFISYIEFLGYKNASKTLEDFISLADVIEINKSIIDQTILIRKSLNTKLPDAIIAATAIVYTFTLVTHNTKDFRKINGLKILNPYSI